MKWVKVDDYIRISKRKAEKLYGAGEIIYLCPSKLRPGDPWHAEVAVCLTDGEGARVAPVAFDYAVSMFEFYNCSYATGEYASYYVCVKSDEVNT